MNTERLEKLAKFLDTLPKEKFDIEDIVKEFNPETNCGAVCCAIGWCPVVFPGLCFYSTREYPHVELYNNETIFYGFFPAAFTKIAEELFDIDFNTAYQVFSSDGYLDEQGEPTNVEPQRVAAKIYSMIREYDAH